MVETIAALRMVSVHALSADCFAIACQAMIDRKGEHPRNHLSGYKGWVHADGYSDFNDVFGDDKVNEMACMAHVRRKFVDIFAAQGSSIAEEVIKRIAKLYAIEKEARGNLPEERAVQRQADAKTVFKDLNGCTPNCPKYRASRHRQRQSVTFWTACRRHVHI